MAFGFFKDLFERFSGKPVDWDELEETLIRSDIGVPMTLHRVPSPAGFANFRQRDNRGHSGLHRTDFAQR
jgi:hypothetical protein